MRKFIAHVATSADGFIARKDGSFDWLDRPQPPDNYGMNEFIASIDAVVWGRTTYEQGIAMGGQMNMFGRHIQNYVFTKRSGEPLPQFTFVNESVTEFAARMRAMEGKNIWLMGGAGLYASFLDADAIDEFSINVVPVMIGEGIPLLAPRHRTVQLELLDSRSFADGVVQLHYNVKKA